MSEPDVFTGKTPSNTDIRLSVIEQHCRYLYQRPFNCPTCKGEIEMDNLLKETKTHARCLNSSKCPRFCIICLKTETPETDLLSHNGGYQLNYSVCPSFLEYHGLFSKEPLEARKDFRHWLTVARMYHYACKLRADASILSIASLQPYAKDFGNLENYRKSYAMPKVLDSIW